VVQTSEGKFPIEVDEDLKSVIEKANSYDATIADLSERSYRLKREFWERALEKYDLSEDQRLRYNPKDGTICLRGC